MSDHYFTLSSRSQFRRCADADQNLPGKVKLEVTNSLAQTVRFYASADDIADLISWLADQQVHADLTPAERRLRAAEKEYAEASAAVEAERTNKADVKYAKVDFSASGEQVFRPWYEVSRYVSVGSLVSPDRGVYAGQVGRVTRMVTEKPSDVSYFYRAFAV